MKPVEAEVEVSLREDSVAEAASESFLIFEDRLRERTALPLDLVERIESVPLSRIEYAGGRPLLQYRGELLALNDRGGVLADLEAQGGEMLATVLIYRDRRREGRRCGMVVRQVLDVSEGTRLGREAAGNGIEGMDGTDGLDGIAGIEGSGGMDLALVKERVTMVHRELGVQDAGAWQEVA